MATLCPGEIKALSGARALPALLIVLFHYGVFHRYLPAAALLGPPAMKGYLWVEFFFALTGFLLIHVYGRRPVFGRAEFRAFLKARLARLYPLHLFTLLTMLGLMLVLNALADAGGYVSLYHGAEAPLNSRPSFLANLFLVQAWNLGEGLSWNAPAWFVSIEFLLCLSFPVFLFLSRGGVWRGLALIAAGFAWLVLLAWNSHVGLDITFENGMFRGLAGFAVGAGMAMVFRAASGWHEAAEWKLSAVQAALLLFILWAVYFSGPDHSRADLWCALGFDALIPVLAFDRGFLARFFALPALARLGGWSYAIYMGQMFWLQFARYLERRALPHGFSQGWLEPLALLAICILWGALLARFVERPANAFLKRTRRKPDPA